MTKKIDTIEVVVDVFNTAMDVQNLYLKKSPFPMLTMSEMHVLDAVDKEPSPSMSAVAHHLNITMGTLTTAVKKIIDKGFLYKEQSKTDQRIYYLRLTSSGKEAVKVHEQFHKELDDICKQNIPDAHLDWVFENLKKIHEDLVIYRDQLLKNK